jgi:serine/threonine protein kinase
MDTFSANGVTHQPPAIDNHDPVRCLGSGTQGQVWLMAPQDGSPAVAAKYLAPVSSRPGAGGDGDLLRHNERYITQEWRLLTQFRHEHLIGLQRLVRDESGAHVLLMDHAAGGSLAQIVRAKGPMTVGEAVTVLTPVGQVLSFLHGRGAVHGDVSPGNILLSAAGKPYLSDFGFGRMLGQAEGPPTGTPGFYCQRDTSRTEASDVYSLASVGWFLLTGRPAPPTRDRLPLGTFAPEVPAELVAALEAGLQENAVLRPTAAAFAQAVFRSAKAAPVSLGNAVHPSVLPELLTRHDVKARRTRGPVLRCAQRIVNLAMRIMPSQRGPRQTISLRSRSHAAPVPRSRRHGALVWASEAGVVRRPRNSKKRLVSALVVMAAIAVAAALTTIQGSWGLSRAISLPDPTASMLGGEDASLTWAAGLPAEKRKGLSAQDPVEALHALAWARSYALSNADADLLAGINAPGSAAFDADKTLAGTLRSLGHSFTGLDISVSEASTDIASDSRPAGDSGSADDPATVTVHATITTSAFAEQDAGGVIVHRQSEPQQQELIIVMTRVDQRWAIAEILPAGSK